eukprot:TRINITY_DN9482_c0_g1_i1.p1 TRINITY_DN9482_c0_g1~~TRINITY_DN9482_c0_g1_i1.p1  ORF type:complete len:122 (+),score=16.39 TRINITY_DN9482_c0_g1_i1:206-571(+)
MDSNNLSIIFGPTLIKPKEISETADIICVEKSSQIVLDIIQRLDDIVGSSVTTSRLEEDLRKKDRFSSFTILNGDHITSVRQTVLNSTHSREMRSVTAVSEEVLKSPRMFFVGVHRSSFNL